MNLGSWSWGFVIASSLFLSSIPPASAANSLVGSATCGDINIDYSPVMLWPPNHKLHTIAISATDTDKDADTFTVTVSNITSSQNETPGEGCGQPSGKQGPDFTGVENTAQGSDPDGTALTSVQLRAERCAKLGERVYDIEITCSETNVSGESNDTAHLTVIVHKSRSH